MFPNGTTALDDVSLHVEPHTTMVAGHVGVGQDDADADAETDALPHVWGVIVRGQDVANVVLVGLDQGLAKRYPAQASTV